MDEARLAANVAEVRARISLAARRSGRDPSDVTLVAVTKLSPAEAIAPLVALGVRDLGENYPQELWCKAESTSGLTAGWHLIGHLQSNKAKRSFSLVRRIHAVDSLRLLAALDKLAAEAAASGIVRLPKICLQVNTSGETTKHGWSEAEIFRDAARIAEHATIPIDGLMTMAALDSTADEARESFAKLRTIRDRLAAETGLRFPELSMGMSGDFELAIEEGATLVRVGTALFEGVWP